MSSYPPILNKRQFVREYQKGTFGNRAPTWHTLGDFAESDYRGKVHLRNRVAGGETYYNLSRKEAIEKWLSVPNREGWYLSGMAPHEKGLIQGEVMETERGLELFYAPALVPMREALAKEGRTATGLLATSLLRTNLNPKSYDWLMVLLERYEGHVIEFSAFSVCWGTLPGYNAVIWECRLY